MIKKGLFIITSLAMLTACGQVAKVDQSKLCQASSDGEIQQCTPGELVYFRPPYFGNEQLPLNVAAAYCDFNYQVMHNPGGVLCVYTNKRVSLVGG